MIPMPAHQSSPNHAYELPRDPDRPNAREYVIRPEPLTVGDRLRPAISSDEHQWEVTGVERTGETGKLLGLPLSGPPGFPRQPGPIWGGRLVLRRVP